MIDIIEGMKSKDRILPVQDFFMNYYKGDPLEYYDRLHDLLISFRKSDNLKEFKQYEIELPEGLTYFQMGSDLPSLHFLQFIIRLGNYKEVLEIGTFMGVSAMHLADATINGHVTTVEIGKDFYEMAKRNITRNGYSSKVDVIHADANQLVETLPKDKKFDFISIDGDKGKYCNLFKMLLPYLSDDGLIMVDDALFHGDVLNDEPVSEKGRGVKELLEEVAKRPDVEGFLLPMSNGKLLIRRVQ
jgi:caffeoyl-CoA O-methyltransferase/O-methyltransferase